MIESQILYNVRNGIAAIGYTTVPRREYTRDPISPDFQVVGSGFLVRDTTLLTNRHVIEELDRRREEKKFPEDDQIIVFTVPESEQGLLAVVRLIREVGVLAEHHLDVGFVEFNVGPQAQFKDIPPLVVQELPSFAVTQPVAVSGYPYGHAMLQKDGKVYRWGPVTQQGYISAISPFDTTSFPSEILLDLRAAGGMSGAPIFRPDDGEVIGILHSIWESTTAVGLPLTRNRVDEWLANWDNAKGTSAGNESA